MSKNRTSPSLFVVCIHTFLVLITGGFWLLPLGIYLALKFLNNK